MSDRPALVRIEQTSDDTEAHVIITLEWNQHRFDGEAYGAVSDTARPRLLGEATLRAVEALSPTPLRLSLDAIASTRLGTSRVAMAQVDMDGSPSLVGSALQVGEDPAAAPVRAVLDAVNRRLGLLIGSATG